MNPKLLIGLTALLSLLSCGPAGLENGEPPAWVWSEEKMTKVLSDVHLAEGAKMAGIKGYDSLSAADYYQLLWAKHQTSRAMFDSNFSWYSRHAQRMDAVYARVLERLSAVEAQHQASKKDD